LLAGTTCTPVQAGNVTFNLNQGDKFSVPSTEFAVVTVITGSISVDDHYRHNGTGTFRAGQGVWVDKLNVITVLENNTKLYKRFP
jgi:hypothetical protein